MNKKITILVTIFIVSFIAIFMNLFPNFYAWKNTPYSYQFSGQASWFDPWDINVYVSAIKWGQHQGFLLENIYDSASNQAIFYYPVYTTLGLVFRNINPFLLFHCFSALTTILLISTLTLLIKRIFPNQKTIFFTVLSISLAGGLGWLVYPIVQSIDTHMTSITLLSAFQRPHEAIALSAYFTALFGFYFAIKSQQKLWKIITFISFFITLIFYPYYALSLLLICGIYCLLNKQLNRKNLLFLLITILIGVITTGTMFCNLSLNSSFSGVANQTLTKPTLISFILGYGLLLIPYVWQLIKTKPNLSAKFYFVTWITISFLLSFFPFGFSRFFLRGVYAPLVMLAIISIQELTKKYLKPQYPKILFICLIYLTIFLSITNGRIFFTRITEVKNKNPWYYISQNNYQVLQKIENDTPVLSGILSEYYLGNLIPAHTKQRVYFGHLLQTPNAEERKSKLTQFYQQDLSEDEALKFLTQAAIQYVIYGANEKQLNNSNNELSYSFLSPIYSNSEVILYEFLEKK